MAVRVLRTMVVVLGCAVATLRAHDPGISTLTVGRVGTSLIATFGVAPGDLALACNPHDPSSIQTFARRAIGIGSRHGRLSAAAIEIDQVDAVSTHVILRFDAVEAGPIEINFDGFDAFGFGHRCLVLHSVDGRCSSEALLHSQSPSTTIGIGAAPGRLGLAADFVVLGVEHILIGWDHILFLLSLLVVSRGWRSSLATVSAFTVAHSVTLCLASLDILQLPSRWVEAVIALSVVAVAIENVARRGRVGRGRWLTTAGFGLIHGFGFASVLAELNPGTTESPALALASFNIGVELGQLAIAAVVLPCFALIRRHWPMGRTRLVPVVSVTIAVVGCYWLCERTIGF